MVDPGMSATSNEFTQRQRTQQGRGSPLIEDEYATGPAAVTALDATRSETTLDLLPVPSGAGARPIGPEMHDAFLAALPHLRAFAISLTGERDRADDFVQEAVLQGWAALERFQPGSNLRAWLFTILRNSFYTAYRKRRIFVETHDRECLGSVAVCPEQPDHLDFADFRKALARLPPEQREALLLVGAEGLSYEEAADVTGLTQGALKSRVHRARLALARLLDPEGPLPFGPDQVMLAAVVRTH